MAVVASAVAAAGSAVIVLIIYAAESGITRQRKCCTPLAPAQLLFFKCDYDFPRKVELSLAPAHFQSWVASRIKSNAEKAPILSFNPPTTDLFGLNHYLSC